MKGCHSACVWAWTLVWAFVPAGCSQGTATLEFRYTDPAEYALDARVRRLAVVSLVGRSPSDRAWAARATQRIRKALVGAGKTSHFRVVQPKAPGPQPLDVADSAAARKLGKAVGADAVIHGTVEVIVRTRQGSAESSSAGGGVAAYIRHDCRVNLHCVITDVSTGGTTSLAISEEHRQPAGGPGAATQAAKESPPKKRIARVVDRCADSFVRRIVSRQVVVTVRLADGGHRMVGRGNDLAVSGQLDDALECYRMAILKDPRDHGAAFNAGVIHEARGRLEKAAEMYDRAIEIQAEPEYRRAGRRVSGRRKSKKPS